MVVVGEIVGVDAEGVGVEESEESVPLSPDSSSCFSNVSEVTVGMESVGEESDVDNGTVIFVPETEEVVEDVVVVAVPPEEVDVEVAVDVLVEETVSPEDEVEVVVEVVDSPRTARSPTKALSTNKRNKKTSFSDLERRLLRTDIRLCVGFSPFLPLYSESGREQRRLPPRH